MALARLFVVLIGTAATLVLASTVSAQTGRSFDPNVFGTNLSVELSPQYPRAGDTVHLSAQATGLPLADSAIVWRSGGKILAQGVGRTAIEIVAGALGTSQTVLVDAETPDGVVHSAQAVIAPAEVDLLTGSDSYTPPFYRGRALPSAGTNLIAQALTRFKRPDGTFIPDTDLTYTWKRNNEVLGDLSGRGKSSAVIAVAHLYSNDTITVDAMSSDGVLVGEASVIVPPTQPVLDLYIDHPLYGIMYNDALPTSLYVPESEMSFTAAPYFAEARSPNDAALSYEWRVNDVYVSPNAAKPSELTINADNSSGQAQVGLAITRATNFYMNAVGLWNVVFKSGASAQNVFRASAQTQ